MKTDSYIKASEIGNFIYCKRAWWLRLNKLLPDSFAMQQGATQHDHLASLLAHFKIKQMLAWLLILLGIIIAGTILGILFSQP